MDKGKARAELHGHESVWNADILHAVEEVKDNIKQLLAELKRKCNTNSGHSEDSRQSAVPAEGSSKSPN
ncbi:hypothetical protein L227DRAFT_608536 [Lentinus tigrinus ALCF2SS1-6]|uniref:Uncharacterized protein n=1 Tax=Lentinus tigrinus ALCF2SS1-6 TaxID=1328759 RepID=A0A5C2SP65_9APHY|nr:hypothetical protein L227DRAFT_608536 [Lentinus tigrinus ALCF2SS1-6]